MATCQVTPKIINRDGQEVPSQLWADLMKINNNRDWIKNVYLGTHTDHFSKWFGNWIDDEEGASLAVDENGEPKIFNVVRAQFGDIVPAFISVTKESTYAEIDEGDEIVGLAPESYKVVWDETGGQVDISKQRAIHPDPVIQADINRRGALNVNEFSNQYVWDMSEKLGLYRKDKPWSTDKYGKKFKPLSGFSFAKANKLAKKAREEGFEAIVKQRQMGKTGRTNYIVTLSKDISQKTGAQNRLVARFAGFKETSADLRERWKAAFEQQEKLTDLESLHRKVTDAFERRISIMEKQYDFIKRQDFQEFLDDYMESNNVTQALVSAVVYSAKITNQLFNKYRDMQKNNEPLDARALQTWSDFLIAYDTLDELQNLILKDPSIIQNKEVIDALQDSITKKNFLKDLYKTEGVKILAEWLTPYYNGIYSKFKDKRRAEWRKEYNKKKRGGKFSQDIIREGETREQYVKRLTEFHDVELRKQTKTLLLTELQTASRDISELDRWIDNMLDTSDVVASAVVNAFVQADERSRVDSIRKRTEILKATTEFEIASGKTNFDSEIKHYSWFLEFDKQGVPAQHLLRPWFSGLIEEESRQRIRIYRSGEEEDPNFIEELRVRLNDGEITKEKFHEIRRNKMHEKMDSWRQDHLQIDKELMETHLLEYMEGLIDKVDLLTNNIIITKEQYTALENGVLFQRMSPNTLAKEGKITDEAAELYNSWKAKNRWKYSDVIEEWRNPQWNKFMKKIGISTKISYYRQDRELRKSDNYLAKYYSRHLYEPL